MKVKELSEALRQAKSPKAEVRMTDKEGSFNEEIFTVEESGDGDVLIVIQGPPKL